MDDFLTAVHAMRWYLVGITVITTIALRITR